MNTFDYNFVFDDVVDGYSSVILTNHEQSTPSNFVVSIDDSHIYLLNGRCLSPIQADLLDLAVAINFADKLALPKQKKSIQVHIYLPLRCPEVFTQVNQELSNLLFQYTSDFWHFHFQVRKTKGRTSERPLVKYSRFSAISEVTEFALWSGGLDSLAGLQTRLMENQDKHFSLVGTGSNNIMRKTQQRVFRSLHRYPHAIGRLHFLHIPIKAKYEERYSQNSTHRARGIVFLLIGAVAALANGKGRLHVYENGMGALNLPLPGGVGRDHSKAVHPISLINLGNFISGITGKNFLIENPYIFYTKAEMCHSLQNMLTPTFATISCDRLHREKYIQCGFCSSCILRRQALAAAGIKDKTKYLIPHGKKPETRHRIYWDKMNQQVAVIGKAIRSSDAWFQLSLEYSDLPEIVSHLAEKGICEEHIIKDSLIRLYRTYVQEWHDVSYSIVRNMAYDIDQNNDMEARKWQQMRLIK